MSKQPEGEMSSLPSSGRWAIVLGGSSGFGLAAVEKLARHGMHVASLYRETALVERPVREQYTRWAAAAGVKIIPFNINALDTGARLQFLSEFKAAAGDVPCVRLLLHSIARGNLKPLMGIDAASTLSKEDIQLTGYAMSTSMLDWARSLIEERLFLPDARIIGLTSAGAHKYWESYAAVSIAKASLESLATYMAVEMGKYGLRTNLIRAGITATPSLKKIPGSKQLIEMSTSGNPLGRMTTAEDVANVIYLLCSEEAAWINGSVIHVDGGEHCV
ncbi:MAG: SDR family oxidoreductase [Bacteroidota bacterium]|nr:SDR family oxidoreductase [Bacteroidota bacterium]